MDRRTFIGVAASGLVLTNVASALQGGAKPPVVGVLHSAAFPRSAIIDTLVQGLRDLFPGLAAKWLELLKGAAPTVRHVGVLWDSTTGRSQLRAIEVAAQRFSVVPQILEVHRADDFEVALKGGVAHGAKAIVMLSSPIISFKSTYLADFTLKNRLPAVSPFSGFANAGGLMSYGPDLWDFYRRTASYVDKILKGAKPAELPVEQPTKFELIINLKTANAIGTTIPQSLLLRADEAIQ